MFASVRENIWACWKGVMRPAGVSMTTAMPSRPRIAYSAELPVSPLVAPTIVIHEPRRASSYSKSSPSSCIAMSLKAAVGPLDRWPSHSGPSPMRPTGTIRGSENFPPV